MKWLTKVRSVLPSKGSAGWGWEWGSTTHPIIGHAIIGAPFAFVSAGYMVHFGGHWLASIYGGVFTVLLAAAFQEWSDQRSHDAIVEHHKQLEFGDGFGNRMREGDTASEFVDLVRLRDEPPVPEVWGGWDWKDFVGFAIGAQVGAALAVIVL